MRIIGRELEPILRFNQHCMEQCGTLLESNGPKGEVQGYYEYSSHPDHPLCCFYTVYPFLNFPKASCYHGNCTDDLWDSGGNSICQQRSHLTV